RPREWRWRDPSIENPQRTADRAQTKIGAASFIRNRKAITADTDFAAILKRKTDAARAHDDDPAIPAVMRADAGDRRIVHVRDGAERMRPRLQLCKHRFAADTCKTDNGVQPR